MKITLFNAQQATQLAQELSPHLEQLVAWRQELRTIETRLEVLSLALAGATPENPDMDEARALGARRADRASRIRLGLGAILEAGAIVKDLDTGLLDFYALSGDRLVFLCWKLGESEVKHWHPLEGGFTTRRPLDQSPLEN